MLVIQDCKPSDRQKCQPSGNQFQSFFREVKSCQLLVIFLTLRNKIASKKISTQCEICGHNYLFQNMQTNDFVFVIHF